jgi:Asp-tRNA(Asn)/Glu-tRNA(Gln) amidotransferase A subunit family amidase
MDTMARLFAHHVDLVLTPSTAITAPPIPPRALWRGEVNATLTSDATRFMQLANLTGLPGVTVPAGYDDNDLPIGLHLMAKWYDESLLLRMAKVAEEVLGSGRRKPRQDRWFGELLD